MTILRLVVGQSTDAIPTVTVPSHSRTNSLLEDMTVTDVLPNSKTVTSDTASSSKTVISDTLSNSKTVAFDTLLSSKTATLDTQPGGKQLFSRSNSHEPDTSEKTTAGGASENPSLVYRNIDVVDPAVCAILDESQMRDRSTSWSVDSKPMKPNNYNRKISVPSQLAVNQESVYNPTQYSLVRTYGSFYY